MSSIKIVRLDVSGPNKPLSTIEFGDKITIIAGPSDSGKTCIYKCINWVLGASHREENIPLDEQDGFDTIALTVDVGDGRLVIKRKIDWKKIEVESSSPSIESGEYLLDPTKANPKSTNDFFLSLLGLPTDLSLPKNDKGEINRFTWRTIIKAFMVDENRADSPKSILLAKENQTLYIASLLYLLTGNELDEYKSDKESEKIKKAKHAALLEYIKGQRTSLETKKKEYESKLKDLEPDTSIEQKIEELNNQIDELNAAIDRITEENQMLAESLLAVQNRIAKNISLMSRYKTLNGQYTTDISRLTFIVDNEELIKQGSKPTKCPYCDNDMKPHDHSSYLEASRAELVKLIQKTNELEETRAELQDKIDDDEQLANDYKERTEENRRKIRDELSPQRTRMANMLQSYKEYLSIMASLEYMKQYDVELGEEQEKYEKTAELTSFTPFKGREMLFNTINESIAANAKSILEAMHYEPLETIEFSDKSLDLVVNKKRKVNRGKGFKAFTNSVLLLAFQKLLSDKVNNLSFFYIFDSPLKGLSIAKDTDYDHDVRVGYFNYLVNLDTSDQIIVIDNTKEHELPELRSNEHVKIYEFTGNERIDGRYGFLIGVRK